MKHTFILLLLVSFCHSLLAQLNNTMFEQRSIVKPSDSTAVYLEIDALGFTKNNEYFGDIADGFTLFGYQFNPQLSYQPTANFKIQAGVYLQKDFGNLGYQEIAPTFSFKYTKNDMVLIFGNLEGSVSHRLIEPLYDFEKVMIDRLENGMQVIIEKEKFFFDAWIDWQKMIYKGDPEQERVSGGLSLNYKLVQDRLIEVSIPVQFLVTHVGGQIDDNPAPLQTFTNTALGLSLERKTSAGLNMKMDSYYVSYNDFSNEPAHTYSDGGGLYLNMGFKIKSSYEIMGSYWNANEFVSIMGGQLYPSVSSTYKDPLALEENRELFILRLMHNIKVTDNIYITSRFEPYYDIGNSRFEFSHGFYINYSTDLFMAKKQRR